MGLFDGIEKAEIFERGRYLPPGFKGTVEVKRTLAKNSRQSGTGFIVELTVVDVEQEGDADHELSPVRLGEKRTWWQGLTNQDVALPAIKEFMAVLAGYERHEKDAIARDVSPTLKSVLDYAIEHPDDNDLVGCKIRVETQHKTTKQGRDFTLHNWTPYEEPETAEPGS